MQNRSKRLQSSIRNAVATVIESLEGRLLLTGVVFQAPINLATSSESLTPVFANLADFNNDGKADLFVANSTDSVSVLTSNFSGTTGSFNTAVTIPVAGTPLPLATGYFDNAAPTDLDIVAGTTGTPGDISLILGNGNGTFQAANNVPALDNNQAIAVGDFTNNGDMDVLSVSGSSTPTDNAMLLLGNGAGGLTAQAPFSLPFGNVAAVAVGDFNGDGNLDFAVVNEVNSSVSIFLGNGNGTFQSPITYATGPSPTSIVVGDFNGATLGNGMPALDIVTADSTGGEISFLDNNGSGGFNAPVNSTVAGSAPGGGPLKVRTANFTSSSGNQDLVVLLSHGGTAAADVLLSNGNGTWHEGALVGTSSDDYNAIAAGDINDDGFTDVVLTNSSLISASINTTKADTSIPTASVDANQANGSTFSSTYDFTVTYTDSQQIDASTLGNGNLVVTFPNSAGGTQEAATLVSTNLGNAASVDATYQITFPSNLTAAADNGTYAVSINANSVLNAGGVAVTAGSIGSFTLNVVNTNTTPPSASVDPTATQPPGSNQSKVYDFNVTYTDPLAVNVSTLGNSNLIVTFPLNSQSEAATLISTGLTNGPVVHATYQITFAQDLTTANNGGYQVSINANSVLDTTGLAVPAGSIGAFTLTVTNPDTIPPTARVDSTQASPSTSSSTYNFTVTYSDNIAVDPNSLGNSNLTVTYPDGTQHAATLISQTNTSSTSIDATYQIAFASNISSSNDGAYNVTIAANSVTDTSGNPVAAGNIGSFAFAIGGVAPTGDFAVSAPTGKFLASVVSGSKQKGGASVVITYNGTATLTKATVTTTLYASATQIHDGSAVQVGTAVTKKVAKLKPGKKFTIHFAPFAYPGTAGSYYLVSDVALNGTLDSYDGAIASPISVQAAFVDADAVAVTPVKATLVAGAKAVGIFTIENLGNTAITGGATVDVGVVPAGSPAGTMPTVIAMAIPVNLRLNPSQTKKVRVTFTPANLPASGSYDLAMKINVVGDTISTNDVMFSTTPITI